MAVITAYMALPLWYFVLLLLAIVSLAVLGKLWSSMYMASRRDGNELEKLARLAKLRKAIAAASYITMAVLAAVYIVCFIAVITGTFPIYSIP